MEIHLNRSNDTVSWINFPKTMHEMRHYMRTAPFNCINLNFAQMRREFEPIWFDLFVCWTRISYDMFSAIIIRVFDPSIHNCTTLVWFLICNSIELTTISIAHEIKTWKIWQIRFAWFSVFFPTGNVLEEMQENSWWLSLNCKIRKTTK